MLKSGREHPVSGQWQQQAASLCSADLLGAILPLLVNIILLLPYDLYYGNVLLSSTIT